MMEVLVCLGIVWGKQTMADNRPAVTLSYGHDIIVISAPHRSIGRGSNP
jgi:hypothetical protein